MTDVTIDFQGEELCSPWLPIAGNAPAVLVLPTVMGIGDLEVEFARRLNALGYHALVGDLFGTVNRGAPREIMFPELQRLKGDRPTLLRRLQALMQAMLGQPGVDPGKVAVIGYCFGGLCALDLARSGATLAAAASFHGLFDPPGMEPQKFATRVVAYHGWDDPMVPPDAVTALAAELTAAGADWQIHGYGHVGHGFTNPHAGRMGVAGVGYNALAAKRSWASLELLLAEAFE
ncbi:MAG: dienelactone hydrolase family protein [Sphingomicrobium sp.]